MPENHPYHPYFDRINTAGTLQASSNVFGGLYIGPDTDTLAGRTDALKTAQNENTDAQQQAFEFCDEPFPGRKKPPEPVVAEWVQRLKGIKSRELARRAASADSKPPTSPAQVANGQPSDAAPTPAEPLPIPCADTCRDTDVTPTAPENRT